MSTAEPEVPRTYADLDDLRIVHNAALAPAAPFTVCALVRDEMYFLPAFLAHYRALGIRRFVLLDDRSVDGSRAFLMAQPDVLLVESDHRYGDRFYFGETARPRHRRMIHVWKTLLLRRFCLDHWALCVDADEFVQLPPGMTFADLPAARAVEESTAIAGVMLDVYPAGIAEMRDSGPFDPAGAWYFDALPHLEVGTGGLRILRHGARERLLQDFVQGPAERSLAGRLRRLFRRPEKPEPAALHKNILLRSGPEDCFIGSHETTHRLDPGLLLPIAHFKFTPDLHRRTRAALASGEYFKGSREYGRMHALLTAMERAGGRFLGPHSRPIRDFAAFADSGNARLGRDGGRP